MPPVRHFSKTAKAGRTTGAVPVSIFDANNTNSNNSNGSNNNNNNNHSTAGNRNSSDAPASAGSGRKVPEFLTKTHAMLSGGKHSSVVTWTKEGGSFIVLDVKAFEKDVLPCHFKHNKFGSFVRQLNMYSFKKLGDANHWEYAHDNFVRDDTSRLRLILRKSTEKTAAVAAAAAAPPTAAGISNLNSSMVMPMSMMAAAYGVSGASAPSTSASASCGALARSSSASSSSSNHMIAELSATLLAEVSRRRELEEKLENLSSTHNILAERHKRTQATLGTVLHGLADANAKIEKLSDAITFSSMNGNNDIIDTYEPLAIANVPYNDDSSNNNNGSSSSGSSAPPSPTFSSSSAPDSPFSDIDGSSSGYVSDGSNNGNIDIDGTDHDSGNDNSLHPANGVIYADGDSRDWLSLSSKKLDFASDHFDDVASEFGIKGWKDFGDYEFGTEDVSQHVPDIWMDFLNDGGGGGGRKLGQAGPGAVMQHTVPGPIQEGVRSREERWHRHA